MAEIDNTDDDAVDGADDTAPKGKSVISDNSVLKAAEDKIEGNLTPELKPLYAKVLVAGMKAGIEGGEDSILAKLKESKDPIGDCGRGAAALVQILRKNSRDSMSLNAMVPAGAVLMLHALDFVQKAGIADVGQSEVATASKAYADAIFKYLGVTPQMLMKGNEAVEKATKDPAVMEQMKRKAGLVKAPGTSSPTDTPDEEEPPADDEGATNGV